MKKKKSNIYKTIMLMILTMLITFICTAVFLSNFYKERVDIPKAENVSSDKRVCQVISKFRELIDKEYIGGDINEQALIDGAVKGYIEALGDPYSEYFTSSEMEEVMEKTTGNYIGIGTYLGADTINNVIYLWPMTDSPAAKAGIKNDDILLKVNNQKYDAEDLQSAVDIMKQGNEGEEVTLQIKRGEEVKDIVVKKEKIVLKHVTSEMLEDNIGLIKIDSFEGDTSEEFKNKYEELKKDGMKKLIIDLRNNGGGIVNEALEIGDYLLEKDKVMLVQTGKDKKEKVSKSKKDSIVKEPIVVLINEGSASASEILAAALKENNRATLVGKLTYGKGVIQTMRQFTDGSGIKLTTEEFLTPERNRINGIGIKPNIEVDLEGKILNKVILEKDEDTQLKKAIEEIKNK